MNIIPPLNDLPQPLEKNLKTRILHVLSVETQLCVVSEVENVARICCTHSRQPVHKHNNNRRLVPY